MILREVGNLIPGDEVQWTDPDDGLCSRTYTISQIEIEGEIVKIWDRDGSYLECFASELS